MNRELMVGIVLVGVLAGCGGKPSEPLATPTLQATSAAPATNATPVSDEVQKNRNERTGPSWSPRDLAGPDGKLLTLGQLEPGAFGAVKAGESVDTAIAAGYLEEDKNRPCDGGTFYKWRGQWSSGMDVLVGDDKRINYLGLNKAGLETAEGISIGNSYGALKATYGDKLSEPETMDYGQPGVFLQDGTRWLGFLLDAEEDTLADDSRIIFIEVSDGDRPGLLRDGC